MKQITSNGWRRVQARTAARLFSQGMTVHIMPGGEPVTGYGVRLDKYCGDSLYGCPILHAWKRAWKCKAIWFYVRYDTPMPARPANHAPAEKSTLAARINQYYKHQGHEAPIDYERVPAIPRRLLRELWAEIREHQANALIQQVANSVIM
jgi:hypothetical protein